MYRRFLNAIVNFNNQYNGLERGKLSKPLLLITDPILFNDDREQRTDDYLIINEVLLRMQSIDYTLLGNHRFKYFNSILMSNGFIPEEIEFKGNQSTISSIISLIKQILNFEYQD